MVRAYCGRRSCGSPQDMHLCQSKRCCVSAFVCFSAMVIIPQHTVSLGHHYCPLPRTGTYRCLTKGADHFQAKPPVRLSEVEGTVGGEAQLPHPISAGVAKTAAQSVSSLLKSGKMPPRNVWLLSSRDLSLSKVAQRPLSIAGNLRASPKAWSDLY